MRFLSFEINGQPTYGLDQGQTVLILPKADPTLPERLIDLIGLGDEGHARAAQLAAEAPASAIVGKRDVTLLPVLPDPGKFVCLGLNFTDHAAEGGFHIPEYPALFLRAASSLIADGDPLIRPVVSETFDYEAELVVVIGKTARHVTEEDALSHVFGYSIFNDGSVREYQRKTAQWTAGKNFDGTGAFGPALVPAVGVPPGMVGMRIQSRLNGEVVQNSNLGEMIFPVAQTVSLLSTIMTLDPGDVIAMGTPAGVGHARRPQLWMKPGDVCEVEIEGLGVLRNPVADEVLATDAAQAAE